MFLEGVVLGLVRADLEQPATRKDTRKLSPHLYEALKRALYKPAAFFKGIVFPLLDVSGAGCPDLSAYWWLIARFRGGARSRRPLSSLLCLPKSKCRSCIRQLRSSASQGWTTPVRNSCPLLPRPGDSCIRVCVRIGPNSLFIRVLLDKKHALPYKVLDALVFHFIRLGNTHAQGSLPVLWHQSLLVLCQRYAAHLAPEQKDALRDVVRAHPHAQIAPEIRRELAAAPARGEATVGADAMDVS